MKKLLSSSILLFLPFLFPPVTFAAIHNQSMHHAINQTSGNNLNIIFLFIIVISAILYLPNNRIFHPKGLFSIRISLFSFISTLVILGVFATHIIPTYMIAGAHHSDQNHTSSQHHPCCAPAISSIYVDPLTNSVARVTESVMVRPENVSLKSFTSLLDNKSPPQLS